MFIELECHSHFSLLQGASSPERLVERAIEIGMPALALTDCNGLYAASTFYRLCRDGGIQPIIGAELSLEGGEPILLLCCNMEGYSALSQLITESYRGRPKGDLLVTWRQLERRAKGWICLANRDLERLQSIFPGSLYVRLTHHLEEGSLLRCHQMAEEARRLKLPYVATNRVRYARREDADLYDLLLCIDRGLPLRQSREIRPSNHERYLKGGEEMAALFAPFPDAIVTTEEIAERCCIDLNFSRYRFPTPSLPQGKSASQYLREECEACLPLRYPETWREVQPKLDHELQLIEKLDLSGYFLIVWDIVEFARKSGILAQGRGSAANSLVAYLLGVTPVDPIRYRLFLGRFINEQMGGPPDIDIDFATRRHSDQPDREDVIQYIYRKYGAEHVAMVCTYITLRRKSALRELGKVFELPEDLIDQIVRRREYPEGFEWLQKLVERIRDTPRHLSIHVGGMVIASRPISELVPLEPARMEGRIVCQWDKDFIEDAGLIKVDILGLGMLSLLRDVEKMVGGTSGWESFDDPDVYEMIAKGDTIGLFQVESRAQMQSLPRTRPRNLSELAIQVAIIRPGPIQGNMVTPYIRRRAGLDPVDYTHPALQPILEETLGVILFQEQVLQVAVALADFSEGEADSLRRAMSRKRSAQAIQRYRQKFLLGAMEKGVLQLDAEAIFASLEGFASYGFCKSHAHSFASITYRSAWLKAYYPAAFTAAILNNQPMGFYSTEVVLEDAKRHGVEIRPVDVNRSGRLAGVEEGAVRLGLLSVSGVAEKAMEKIVAHRPYQSLSELLHKVQADRRSLELLIRAGACDTFGSSRSHLLWQLWNWREGRLPLDSKSPILPSQNNWDKMVEEYRTMGFSAQHHPFAFLRASLRSQKVLASNELIEMPAGRWVRVAGMLVCRQRPPTAKGFVFLTLEDEFGLMNIVVAPQVYERCKVTLLESPLIVVSGVKEEARGVINVKCRTVLPIEL
jgi:error-prone DNA polymerase